MTVITKRCERCGKTSKVKPRERRCKNIVEHARGLNKLQRAYCWGRLVEADKPAKATKSDLDKAAHAGTMLAAALTDMKRTMTRVAKWQRRQAYYMAKAEGRIRVAERKPKEKVDRFTRAIELAED